ncbi:MAG: hypothetical protein A3B38_01705 [Candidatus Levybacteria bacterium RIFCSPLOWO2_01_FULL_36_13]|nr:MAG: hypothetical protein A2684_02940 [Candidatus Levybacteria bacterium RIFCSPHIGHO2_01_FULL_36_15b]OGH35579.1 MAG: hypothetical protein A3B38_01705 [Candidatus Levybacteria bacterium RIFCSPLOWO2_01_FULL_36_13]
MRRKTRLSRYSEKKQKKTFFLSILGIIVLLFLLFRYGLPTLINFSLFLAGNREPANLVDKKDPLYIAPPVFDSMPVATNSSRIEIKGIGEKNSKIELYINGKKNSEILTNEDGKFSLDVILKSGENIFTVRQLIKDNKSEFSSASTIYFKDTPPMLGITFPSDGANFKKEDRFIEVKGNTDVNVTVTVNGFYSVISESNIFSYTLGLHDGENEIKAIAEDIAGNRTEKSVKVNYSP